ncbi:integral membrane sensor domain MASE1 [Blastomonas natatoria]|uniref:Integral membrane sensor domain MASE1 n=1 Tax=Blastomonas natatoria TaxID=34015 RepID=A0A2V3VE67_9SPHN|nr:MASE1 domain-containing protein [Blastomonas natatoria]PXW79111.1 integral membrane sensor domain MASE1 [Blastomonas natatoria]
MISSVQTSGADILAPVITGILYYIAAIFALDVSQGQDGIATVWPPSGILLAALLISPRPAFAWHLLAAAIASLAANLAIGNPGTMSAGFTLANLLESATAALLINYRKNDNLSLSDPDQLIDFCIAAFVSTIISASVAMWFIPTPSLLFCFSWFSTDLLGILLVTPLIMVTRAAIRKKGVRPSNRSSAEVIGIFAMVAGVCALTFSQSTYPLLFLPMLAALIAVSRLGLAGAAGAVLIAGSIGSVSTSLGSGPIMLIAAGPQIKSLFFQFYLLSLFSASLPIGALLAARRKLLGQVSESVRLLQLAESTGQLGHWRLDVKSETVTWS